MDWRTNSDKSHGGRTGPNIWFWLWGKMVVICIYYKLSHQDKNYVWISPTLVKICWREPIIKAAANGNNTRMAEMDTFTAELLIFLQKLASKPCLIILKADYQLHACWVFHSVSWLNSSWGSSERLHRNRAPFQMDMMNYGLYLRTTTVLKCHYAVLKWGFIVNQKYTCKQGH